MTGRAIAIVDLGFGDAGKGLITDFLARSLGARLVVRFNGGAQAGHNVVRPDGRHHTFSQLGAGTLVPGVRTHLASKVVVHPTALLVEAEHLAERGVTDALSRLTVSRDALVVTPLHQAACRLRELARGRARHGSVGVGVGEAVRDGEAHSRDAVRVGDLGDAAALRRRLARVAERVRCSLGDALGVAEQAPGGAQEARVLDDPGFVEAWIDATRPFVASVAVTSDETVGAPLREGHHVLFEGAQGVLLDEDWGFHPYTTWSRCTPANADDLLRAIGFGERAQRLGVARVYAHRHGAGPLPTESPELTALIHEPHNVDGPWQGRFRVGFADLVLARYARSVCSVDAVALTHLDALAGRPTWPVAVAYDDAGSAGRASDLAVLSPADLALRDERTRSLAGARPVYAELEAEHVPTALGRAYGAPVAFTGHGPTAEHVRAAARSALATW